MSRESSVGRNFGLFVSRKCCVELVDTIGRNFGLFTLGKCCVVNSGRNFEHFIRES
jgi:hypothetical protein